MKAELKRVMSLERTYLSERGTLILRVSGSIDLHSTMELRDAILDVFEQPGKVIMDLSRLAHVDAVGIGFLIEINEKVRCRGGTLSLVAVPKLISQVFRLCGLHVILKMYHELDEAMIHDAPQAHG